MEIELDKIVIENFKGIKAFESEFSDNMVITGENGSGKTTVYDAFLWLLFGKDSSGRKDFVVRPLDAENHPIKGLVTAVEAHIAYSGTIHVFRKELHEKVVKKQIRGYETLCTIDDVPKKVGEYDDYINDIVDEHTFKLLTDTYFFNAKLHWKERRNTLLDIAGDIETPEGFDDLIEAVAGRTIEEYKTVLTSRKKKFVAERDEINPRIDELQKSTDEYAGGETSELENQRKAIKLEIQQLDTGRQSLIDDEDERQQRLDEYNDLKGQRTAREAVLNNDTSGIQKFIDERAEITKKLAGKMEELHKKRRQRAAKVEETVAVKATMETHAKTLNTIRSQYTLLKEADYSGDKCSACGQPLPADNVAKLETERNAILATINKEGEATMTKVNKCKETITALDKELRGIQDEYAKLEIQVTEGNTYRDERMPVIEKAIASNTTIPPSDDREWNRINDQCVSLAKSIGEPASSELSKIEADRRIKSGELATVEKSLAASDQVKKNGQRIAELEAKEIEIAQSIATIEKELTAIEQYKQAESGLIEESVNDMFDHVKFKLFNQLLNGGTEDACEATLNGVPYSDMSHGQRILVGIDIINVLSAFYEISITLFIDNSESMTLPIEAKSQIIELCAVDGVDELTIQKSDRKVAV